MLEMPEVLVQAGGIGVAMYLAYINNQQTKEHNKQHREVVNTLVNLVKDNTKAQQDNVQATKDLGQQISLVILNNRKK